MKIAIIGFGNLGRSLAEGLIKSGAASGEDICVCAKSAETLRKAAEVYGVKTSPNFNGAVKDAETVFLVVKGWAFEEIAPGIDRALLEGKTVVSFMAGVPFEKIAMLVGKTRLVRAMPSLAIAVCDGVIGYTKAPKPVEDLFRKLGYAFEVAPEDIEKVTAFSGCGLGFAAYLIDAFAAAGEKLGFSPEVSAKIAAMTFKSAVDRGDYKGTVKAVATKGGATEQGVLHMDAAGVYSIVEGAVQKAYDKMK